MTETLIDSAHSSVAALPVRLGGGHLLAGACSWADRSLVRDGRFYPRRTMTASERLAYYCSRLPLAEIATTYRFPPTPEVSRQWVERTPDGFTFDVRAWSLLTANPTLPDSLWPDLCTEVRPEVRHRRRLYSDHLTGAGLEECWRRFGHTLEPLRVAGRLGVVICTFPSWWGPRPETLAILSALPSRLPGCRLAVELRSQRWFAGEACETTFECLETAGLALVCVDGPSGGPRATAGAVAATSDVAVVRFMGRRQVDDEPWTWPYRYGDDELASWLPALRRLAESASEVHVLLDNGWRDDAVDNAMRLAQLAA